MISMTWQHYLGAILGILITIGAGILSGIRSSRKGISTSGEHALGTFFLTGSLIGTLVGGASTVGTAQLAYTFGFSAWWFTLGVGLSCLSLLFLFGKPFYYSGHSTLAQFIAKEYGQKPASISALLMSCGNFLAIVSQLLSGVALIVTISPLSQLAAGVFTVVIMISYILFGGMRGSGVVGLIKAVLLYICSAACGVLVLCSDGGFGALHAVLPAKQYFNLIARGAMTDLGAGLSLLLGIVTTQAYYQILLMAKSYRVYRRSLLISAVLIPPIGVASVLVGLYMKIHEPDILPAAAMPLFLMQKLPPLIAGLCLGTLLIAIVGTGAGLTIGLASNLCRDIYKVYLNPKASQKTIDNLTNLFIILVPALSLLFLIGNMGSLILSWSFLALGLRGAVLFAPLCCALWLPGRVPPRYAMTAILAGPAAVIASKLFLPWKIDPVFPGVFVSFVIMGAGLIAGRSRAKTR